MKKRSSRIITPVISKFLTKVMDAIEKLQREGEEPNLHYFCAFHCGLAIAKLLDPILSKPDQRIAFVDAVSTYFSEEEVDNKDPPIIRDDSIELPF